MKLKPEVLFANNRAWASRKLESDPHFFYRLRNQQKPKYLWIGCSDSRVPANEIVGLDPGSIFVHRNVANVVHAADWNIMTVLQFAIEKLNIPHIIVCGHYGCAGVAFAAQRLTGGLLDNWLQPIRRMILKNHKELDHCKSEEDRMRKLCELNVKAQALELCQTSIVQKAWKAGKKVQVHGWIYGVEDGILRDLKCSVSSPKQIDPVFRFDVPEGQRLRKRLTKAGK